MAMTAREAYAGTRSDVRGGTSRLGEDVPWDTGDTTQRQSGPQRQTRHGPGVVRSGEGSGEEESGGSGPWTRSAAQAAPSQVAAGERAGDRAPEGFVLRLCLDLQLDAMLLTLGAAALGADGASLGARQPESATRERAEAAGGWNLVPGRRWRSWLDEDIDVACRLAAQVVASGTSLPAILGLDPAKNVPSGLLDDLVARYEAMWSLLDDIDDRGLTRPGGNGTRVPEGAREHCCRRLDWLRCARRVVPVERVPAGAPVAFLPGELLG
jgi:hypothetical protein